MTSPFETIRSDAIKSHTRGERSRESGPVSQRTRRREKGIAKERKRGRRIHRQENGANAQIDNNMKGDGGEGTLCFVGTIYCFDFLDLIPLLHLPCLIEGSFWMSEFPLPPPPISVPAWFSFILSSSVVLSSLTFFLNCSSIVSGVTSSIDSPS